MFKLIALLFMLLDHSAFFLAPVMPEDLQLLFRQIGRLSFPMFAYSVAMNVKRTRDLSKYLLRMLGFAIITDLIFRLVHAFYPDSYYYTNTLFTFTLGILAVAGLHFLGRGIFQFKPMGLRGKPHEETSARVVSFGGLSLPCGFAIIVGALLCFTVFIIEQTMKPTPDYGLYGIGMIIIYHFLSEILPQDTDAASLSDRRTRYTVYLMISFLYNLIFLGWMILQNMPENGYFQIASSFAPALFFIERRPKGIRPSRLEKWFFYIFYPLHIALLMVLGQYVSSS